MRVKGQSPAAHKAATIALADAYSKCPPWCLPDTETYSDGQIDSHGICITAADFGMIKQQIQALPEYKDMGTNNKIKGGAVDAHLCSTVKAFVAGITAKGPVALQF